MVVVSNDIEVWEQALGRIGRLFLVVKRSGHLEVVEEPSRLGREDDNGKVAAHVPACRMENLGDASFAADHRLRYPCMSGAMANGIGSVEIVEAMGRQGFLGVFGAAGLSPEVVRWGDSTTSA